MEFKRHAQTEVIAHLNTLNDQLGVARNAYLLKKAERDHYTAKLVRGAPGKSHAERTVYVEAMDEWMQFHKELARLEAVYEFLKLKFRIMEHEFQSQYLETKLNESIIRKQE